MIDLMKIFATETYARRLRLNEASQQPNRAEDVQKMIETP